MISIKIDVSKIDKARLYKGEKGTYLTCTMIETPDGKYGDYMIVEEIPKEEREAGKKGTILGNGKTIGKKPAAALESDFKSPPPPTDQQSNEPDESDLPFIITILLMVGTFLPALF